MGSWSHLVNLVKGGLHWYNWATLVQVGQALQNGSHVEKWVTVRKWVTLKKVGLTSKN